MKQFKMTDMCDKRACNIIKDSLKNDCNVGVTGLNDSGKSCFLRSMVAKVNPTYNIRVNEEDTIELLRQTYPTRNILGMLAFTSGKELTSRVDPSVLLIDNTDEAYILDALNSAAATQVLFVATSINEEIAKSMITEEKSGLVVEMQRHTDGIPYVSRIDEISYDGSRYGIRSELYKRI